MNDIFTDKGIFRSSTVEQFLSSSHYERSEEAFGYLYQALTILQLKSFFTDEKINKYLDEMVSLFLMHQNFVRKKNISKVKLALNF